MPREKEGKMAKPYIPPPTAAEVIHDKAWELVEYFTKEFPKATMKIDVEYHNDSRFTIQHDGEGIK